MGKYLDCGLVRNHIYNTFPSIFWDVKNPSQHFPGKNFSLRENYVGVVQRGFDVTEARINNTTIQEYTRHQGVDDLSFNSGIWNTEDSTIRFHGLKHAISLY